MLEACDVGHRVVVRRWVGAGPAGRPVFTDVLGDLLRLDGEQLLVRADRGTDHLIALAEVSAAKRIPPRPTRFSEIAALERVADAAWPAPVREPMGDWVLRSAQGWTNRANSLLPLGDPGQPLDAAIQACVRWYQTQGLPAVINVALPLRRDLAHRLTELGWHGLPVVLVQTANLADLPSTLDPEPGPDPEPRPDREPGPDPATGTRIDLTGRPSQSFLDLVARRKQGLPESAHQVLTGVEQVRFAEVARAGQVLAIARGAVVERWLHLSLVEVVESARRQRLAQRITLALAHWAAGAGATRAVLQVEERNLPAVSLYRRLGFRTHHRYVSYLAPDQPTDPPC